MRADSGPDNDELYQYCQMVRARLARRRGIREEPVSERPSREPTSPEPGGHGLGRTAHSSVLRGRGGELPVRRMSSGREAMVKVCGVVMARVQGHSWVPVPSNGQQ